MQPLPCPQCGTPRSEGPECLRCGVIFAKAVQRAAPRLAEDPKETGLAWTGAAEDAQIEWRLRLFALPLTLLFAYWMVGGGFGGAVSRIFLSMWIHEFGHASTAWLSGHPAFPGPWLTSIAESRSVVMTLLLLAGLVTLIVRSARARLWGWTAWWTSLVLFQVPMTFVLSPRQAQMWIIFGGDGGAMVWGTVLMATFFSKEDSKLRRDWLRWGLLIIGAFAYMDSSKTWWKARTNRSVIPFGENEGVTQSDPTKLVDQFNWGIHDLVGRYVTLSLVCAGALAIIWAIGLWAARPSRT